jgi:hypothetical protein
MVFSEYSPKSDPRLQSAEIRPIIFKDISTMKKNSDKGNFSVSPIFRKQGVFLRKREKKFSDKENFRSEIHDFL